jgi:hypothetical protein
MDVDRIAKTNSASTQASRAQKPATEKDGKFGKTLERCREKPTTRGKPALQPQAPDAKRGKGLDPRFFDARAGLKKGVKPGRLGQEVLAGAKKGKARGPLPGEEALAGLKRNKKSDDQTALTAGALQVGQPPVQAHVAPVQEVAPTSAVRTIPAQEIVNEIVKEVRFGTNELGLPEFQFDFQSSVLEGLKLKVSTDGDAVRASFITQSDAISDIIKENSAQLVQALQNKGLDLAQLDVTVAGSGAGDQNARRDTASQGASTGGEDRSAYRVEGGGRDARQPGAIHLPGTTGPNRRIIRSSTDYEA